MNRLTYFHHLYYFLTALWRSRFGSLAEAARVMHALNIWARRQHYRSPIVDHVYTLKNRLVRLLYETGRCVEAARQTQTMPCWGYGDEGCRGALCRKCDGTGIYRRHDLYAFAFEVGRMRYRWHQPASLVTWPVTLTTPEVTEYKPAYDSSYLAGLTNFDILIFSNIVWWVLALRRCAPPTNLLRPLLPSFTFKRHRDRSWILDLYLPLLCLRISVTPDIFIIGLPSVPNWDDLNNWTWMNSGYTNHDWLGFGWHKERGFRFVIAGRDLLAVLHSLATRAACLLLGHDDQHEYLHGLRCTRCGAQASCAEEGCNQNAAVICHEPYGDGTWSEALRDARAAILSRDPLGAVRLLWHRLRHGYYDLYTDYCVKHARSNGFCYGCGEFYAGIENFDFDPSGLCSNCKADVDDEYHPDDEGEIPF